MGLDGEAVKAIAELAAQADEIKGADGRVYRRGSFSPVIYDPRPRPITVVSLSGLVAYVIANVDRYEWDQCFAIVHAPGHVSIVTNVRGESGERHTIITAELEQLPRFEFGKWYQIEEFAIRLHSQFVWTEQLSELVRRVSSVESQETIQTTDDGITQRATFKKGMSGAIKEIGNLPVTVELQPYRSFTEIDQVASQFLFRMRPHTDTAPATAALFEADGGAWRAEARSRIHAWLADHLPPDAKLSVIS